MGKFGHHIRAAYEWGGVRQEAHMQRPLTLALVLAGVFFLGMIVGYTHVQPEQFEASQPLRQPRG
jgi:hypothetical protein